MDAVWRRNGKFIVHSSPDPTYTCKHNFEWMHGRLVIVECLDGVCRVEEHQHRLMYQCSSCEHFPHMHKYVKTMGYRDFMAYVNGWGSYGKVSRSND